jgi:hypothetical protein
MDHHCKPLGICLGYRNFKLFLLFFLYTGLGSGLFSLTLFASIPISNSPGHIPLALLCAGVSIALLAFAKVFFDYKRANSSTIDHLFDPEADTAQTPSVPVFEPGYIALLPLPSKYNPFEPFIHNPDKMQGEFPIVADHISYQKANRCGDG